MVVITVSQVLSLVAILHACLNAFLLDSEPSTATSILLYLPITVLRDEKEALSLLLHLCLFHAEPESVEEIKNRVAPPHGISYVEHKKSRHHAGVVYHFLTFDLVEVIRGFNGFLHYVRHYFCFFNFLFLLEFLH